MEVTLTINGKTVKATVSGHEMLLDTLRDLGYYGVKRGCENGNCGACLVLFEGKAVNSCLIYTVQAQRGEIVTIEGMQVETAYLREAFVDNGAVQCGFCTPAMIIAAHELLNTNDNPGEEEVSEAMDGNLCRCTGYKKILDAIGDAASSRRSHGAS